MQFIKKIKSEKGYERIGAVGLVLVNALRKTQLMRVWLGTALAVP
jgi:hypothetical protein